MMSIRFYMRFPGSFYAEGPITLCNERGKKLDDTASERAVRKALRSYLNLDRLPRGFEVWPTND